MTRKIRPKICIGLVHNTDKRYFYIHSQILKLKQDLDKDFEVKIIEASYQPKVMPKSIFFTLRRKIWLWKINREWEFYKRNLPRNIFFDLAILIQRVISTVIKNKYERQRAAVDSIVTDKHLRLWANFLENKFEVLVCFEDDAIFKNDSSTRLRLLLKDILKNSNNPIYIDLAGGCSQEMLKVNNLETRRKKDRIYYSQPVTNTACTYLINRYSTEIFYSYISNKPILRQLSIDWLLNKIFILSVFRRKFVCFHMNPTIFEHGSMVRKFKSWLK